MWPSPRTTKSPLSPPHIMARPKIPHSSKAASSPPQRGLWYFRSGGTGQPLAHQPGHHQPGHSETALRGAPRVASPAWARAADLPRIVLELASHHSPDILAIHPPLPLNQKPSKSPRSAQTQHLGHFSFKPSPTEPSLLATSPRRPVRSVRCRSW